MNTIVLREISQSIYSAVILGSETNCLFEDNDVRRFGNGPHIDIYDSCIYIFG